MHPMRLRYCILTDERTRAVLCFRLAGRQSQESERRA